MNLGNYLDQKVAAYREKPLMFFYERTVSYEEFGRKVDSVANGLLRLGFGKGDFIHVLVQNSPETLISYFAIQKIGAVAGPINGWWKAHEVEYLLNDSGGKGLIMEPQYLPILDEIRGRCQKLEIVIEKGENPGKGNVSYSELEGDSAPGYVECTSSDDEPAYIFYTSGTTGNPKGVLLSHKNVRADIRSFQDAMQLEQGLRILVFLPLFHVNAMLTCVASLDTGGAVVLRKQFSASEFWPVIEQYRVNYWSAVPAVYNILLSTPDRDRYDKSSVLFGICGAAPMPVETFRKFEETFHIPIVEGYGLTEGTCVSTINPRTGTRKIGSIGLPCPGQKVKIVDENGNELPAGERGEIVIGGDVVMLGYHNRPQETADALAGGVLHTGDVGYRDQDGYIFIVDRLKDMVIRGGENIYPKEIDYLLVEHPRIKDAACIGVPDHVMGEEVKAFVILMDGEQMTEDEVRDYCRRNLADFKVPKYIEIIEEDFPRNAVGKVLKKEMKKWGITPRPGKKKAERVEVKDIFGTMEARINPDGVKGVTGKIGYRITGEGGGEWTAEVKNGTVRLLAGIHEPDVIMSMSSADFVDLNLGKLDGITAFTSGKLKAEGDSGLLLKSTRFFRKFSPPRAAKEEKREELIMLKQVLSIPQHFTTGPLMGKFLKELRDNRRILGNRCPKCRRIQTPPREVCAVCKVRVDEFVEIGPEGYIVNFDVVYYASPDPLTGESRETPYCIIFVLLDGCTGNDVFWHQLNPAETGRVKKGARVRPVWEENRKGDLTDIKYFELI